MGELIVSRLSRCHALEDACFHRLLGNISAYISTFVLSTSAAFNQNRDNRAAHFLLRHIYNPFTYADDNRATEVTYLGYSTCCSGVRCDILTDPVLLGHFSEPYTPLVIHQRSAAPNWSDLTPAFRPPRLSSLRQLDGSQQYLILASSSALAVPVFTITGKLIEKASR
jgi:hypothetical protein